MSQCNDYGSFLSPHVTLVSMATPIETDHTHFVSTQVFSPIFATAFQPLVLALEGFLVIEVKNINDISKGSEGKFDCLNNLHTPMHLQMH